MAMINAIAPGNDIPADFNVIVEIPADSGPVKYEFDKDTGLIMVDRFMPTSMHYPANYGFIPQTLAEDGDPVDVLVITPYPVEAGCLIRARAIGVLEMTDEAGDDSKVLALPIEKLCAQYSHLKTLNDISQVVLDSMVHFFERYKDLEPNKWVKVKGWGDIEAAKQEILGSVKRYQQEKQTV